MSDYDDDMQDDYDYYMNTGELSDNFENDRKENSSDDLIYNSHTPKTTNINKTGCLSLIIVIDLLIIIFIV